MGTERVLETTHIDASTTVITTDTVSDELLAGVHATLRTFVIADGDDYTVPVATYINQHAAKVGHAMVVEQTQRRLLEQRAMANGISRAVVGGAL